VEKKNGFRNGPLPSTIAASSRVEPPPPVMTYSVVRPSVPGVPSASAKSSSGIERS
jgi:hypothetical protein